MSNCRGKCETWLSSLVGRKLLYPRHFGEITSGSSNIVAEGAGYHTLRINGYAYGSHGIPEGLSNDPDDCIFPNVNIETSFGRQVTTKCRLPIMTGALGSTFIAAKYWNSFAVGAALCGFPIVIGENVVGVDRQSKLENGKIVSAPELERRIDTFLRYYDGYGAIIVQMNVEDTRNGVAQYVLDKYGDKVILELKWGQGAKDIGGEIQVTDIEYARFLKDRGYVVDPDPYDTTVEKAFSARAITSFARHSRLGGTNIDATDKLYQAFMGEVEGLRSMGYKRISLKTGAYGMEALALSIKCASDANLDLLTIDGAGGGNRNESVEHDGALGSPQPSSACQDLRILQGARGEGQAGSRHLSGWRLCSRGSHFQGSRALRTICAPDLHGPRADDSGVSGQQYRRRVQA